MELNKETLKLLKKEISKEKNNASKVRLLRKALLNRYPQATLFLAQGWDTFEASWDPESSPSYVRGAYFSKKRGLQEIKKIQPKKYNPIADQYYLVQITMRELTEAKIQGRQLSRGDIDTIFGSLFLELEKIL
jgi:hypothetical protein